MKVTYWRGHTFYIPIVALAGAIFFASPGSAQLATTCMKEYAAARSGQSQYAIAFSAVELLVRRIVGLAGMNKDSVTVVECSYLSNAEAWYERGKNKAPVGNYIIYSGKWVRGVLGNDGWQAAGLFSHEIAHLRHKDHERDVPHPQKELEADYFAGCALSQLNGEVSKFIDLLSRIREDEASARYPSLQDSYAAVRRGHSSCSRNSVAEPERKVDQKESAAFRSARSEDSQGAYLEFLTAYPAGENARSAVIALVGKSTMANLSTFMIFFDYDRAALTSNALNLINQAAAVSEGRMILVQGYTDSYAPTELAREMSLTRAQAVKDQLVRSGIPRAAIVAVGLGKVGQLIKTAEGVREPQNRRVEISFFN